MSNTCYLTVAKKLWDIYIAKIVIENKHLPVKDLRMFLDRSFELGLKN